MAISAILLIGAATPASLDLSITGLRNQKGNVLICLTENAKAFPDCSKDAHARKLIVPAAKAANVRFDGLAPGTYALSLIHDENANGKLDTRMFMPKEGFGFSRNPAIRFGPPRFSSAQFDMAAGESAQTVKMKYFL